MKNFKSGRDGVTLIALVLTVIVLLILAGISINMIVGNNGILTRAQDAKTQTGETEDIEKIRLAMLEAQIGNTGYQELSTDSLGSALIKDGTKAIVFDNEDGTKHILFLDKKKEYKLDSNGNIENLNINFDAKYVAPSSQDEERNNGVIGIGTDGKPVDMDLWEYTLLTDGTYCLNDENSSNLQETINSGYIGTIIDGKIIGQIPQYISTDNGEHYMPVTSLLYTFSDITQLKEMPKLPQTVTSIRDSFNGCTNLELIGYIPNSVTNMQGTFHGCIKLKNISNLPSKLENMDATFQDTNLIKCPYIPDTVETMRACFYNCSNLLSIENIPKNVTNLTLTFYRCKNLEDINITIPNKVTNLTNTFNGCTKLSGNIKILANPAAYKNCFLETSTNINSLLKLSGDINVLQTLLETKSENSNIVY